MGEEKRWVPRRDGRTYTQAMGVAPHSLPAVHNDTLINLDRALRERVFFVKKGNKFAKPPQPRIGAFNTLSTYQKKVVSLVPKLPSLSLHQFADRYKDASKRKVYLNAIYSLHVKSLSTKDATLQSFVKAEKNDFTRKAETFAEANELVCPRVIQAPSPRIHVSQGRHHSHKEKWLFKAIDRLFGSETVMKGRNATQRGRIIAKKWSKFVKAVAVGMDASRFDQHCSQELMLFSHKFLIDMVNNPRDKRILTQLLSTQLAPKAIGLARDGLQKYIKDGGLPSGCMNTSAVANCVMSAIYFVFSRKYGINLEVIMDGDDSVAIMEEASYIRFAKYVEKFFLNFGLTMKVEEPVRDIEKILFCQSAPIWTPEGYVMMREPRLAAVKDTISLLPLENEKVWKKWLRSVGDCGMSLTGGLPISQEFYSLYTRTAGNAKSLTHRSLETGMAILARGMHRKYQEVHPQTRHSFWLAFGYTGDEQCAIEGELRAMVVNFGDNPLCEQSNYVSYW